MSGYSRYRGAVAVPLLAALGAGTALAAEGGTGDKAPAVEPAAVQALEAMSAYLRTLDSFSIKAEASADVVLDDGQKIQLDRDLTLDYAKGKGLKVDAVSPLRHLTYHYDYKRLTHGLILVTGLVMLYKALA